MMRRLLCNFVSVFLSLVRLLVLKCFHGGKIRFGLVERISPNVVIEMNRNARMVLGDKVRVHSGSKLKVRTYAELTIGSNVRINYNCIIVCHDKITIGERSEFGPSVYLYDHDHDYSVGLAVRKYKTAPIVIGKNCWIGANTVILRGTVLGDNCIVGAGSVLRGQFSSNTLIVQKRNTSVLETCQIPQEEK